MFYFFPLYSVQCPQGLFMTLSIYLVGSNSFSGYRHSCFLPPCCVCGNSDLRQNTATVVNKLIHDLFWNYVTISHDIPKSRLFSLENIYILHLAKYCQLAFLNDLTNLHFHQMLIDILPRPSQHFVLLTLKIVVSLICMNCPIILVCIYLIISFSHLFSNTC